MDLLALYYTNFDCQHNLLECGILTCDATVLPACNPPLEPPRDWFQKWGEFALIGFSLGLGIGLCALATTLLILRYRRSNDPNRQMYLQVA